MEVEGEGPINRTIQPNQEDQYAMLAVQEKVLFISQLAYCTLE